MIRFSKSLLMMSVAVIALSACASEKGPGKIGTKDDIVVTNKGIPGSAPSPAPAVVSADPNAPEQMAPNPAPEVAVAEAVGEQQPLPDNSPAMEAAVQAHEDASAPMQSPTTAVAATDVPQAETVEDPAIPMEPVTDMSQTAPPVQQAPATAPQSVYPATAPAAPVPTPAPQAPVAAAPVPVPAPAPAPISAQQPYVSTGKIDYDTAYPRTSTGTPQTAALAGSAAPAAPVMPSGARPPASMPVSAATVNLYHPDVIRAAQTALQAKGLYKGPASGTIDTEFLNALSLYQGDNKLPQTGVNEKTFRSLGVIQ